MAKARRQMSEALRWVDAVLELVDARLPLASSNPMLAELAGNKPRTLVLTRIDLADPAATQAWLAWFRRQGVEVVAVDARSGAGVNDIVPALERAAAGKRRREAQRGIRPRPVRAMVAGIPNVGKSSLINRLAGRAAAKIGDRPGITKAQQWIRLGRVELLDTPGVLWPKLADRTAAAALAVSGAIKSDILDMTELCAYFIPFCIRHYPQALCNRYQLTEELVLPPAEDAAATWALTERVLEQIARRRGLLQAGGVPATARAAELLIREVQTGRLGRLSFEWPPVSST
ncbi:MAG: ribosome biogenesis GTPase YlqF [Alicyclobacillus sp.]|nr:ribosome biogenesis GTPase YlqF [Alicyclobacillus sp.]